MPLTFAGSWSACSLSVAAGLVQTELAERRQYKGARHERHVRNQVHPRESPTGALIQDVEDLDDFRPASRALPS